MVMLMRRFLAALALLTSSFVVAGEETGASQSALKAAFERARQAQNIDLVLPALRAAQLYVIVRPDADDPNKQTLYLVPSPKGRPAVTVSESLETLQKVQWPKRRITGRELMAELQSGQEIVIAYPDGGDHVTSEQLEWFKQLP